MENRIETVRTAIDALVKEKKPGEFWFVERHMFAVSNFAAMLALKRSLQPETAAIIGLLHDIHTLLTGDSTNHAALGSNQAEQILTQLQAFTLQEISIICNAIKNHSSKATIHDEYSELIKDADVLAHYFYNTSLPVPSHETARLQSLLQELKLHKI